MKKALLPVLIALFAVSCGSRHNITAEIGGDVESVRVFTVDLNDNESNDTILLKNGRFVYDIPRSMSDLVSVLIIPVADAPDGDGNHPTAKTKRIDLIMSHGDRLKIKAEPAEGGIVFTVKGSEINAVMATHHKEFLPLLSVIDGLNIEIEKAFSLPDSEENDRLIDSLFAQRNIYSEQIRDVRKKYIRENPGHELSALYAARYVERDSLEYYLSLVDPAAGEGFLKPYMEQRRKYLAEYLEYQKNKESITEGADAPAFTLADRDGNAVSFAGIHSDYIVLDFWGSWCGFCIAGFPKMKEYYAKYAGKVEFVGIDCRDTHEKWIAALDKYELPWMQVIDNPDDKTAVRYAVEGYPTKILIGPDRKIAAVYLGETDDFYSKLDELFK